MDASRVMGIGMPQWLAMKRGNARRAKVPTVWSTVKEETLALYKERRNSEH